MKLGCTSYEYTPFGHHKAIIGISSSIPQGALSPEALANTQHNPLRYSCEVYDPETALTYYNYRYYNPTAGNWISRDPLEENAGLNLYNFVNNNPVVNKDRLGLVTLDPLLVNTMLNVAQLYGAAKNAISNLKRKVSKALEKVCDDAECIDGCPGCTKEKCKSEAKEIAEKYVDNVVKEVKLKLPKGDERLGKLCYEWALTVEGAVKGDYTCWDMKWAVFVSPYGTGFKVEHNFMTVYIKNNKEIKCVRSLDPWEGHGLPIVGEITRPVNGFAKPSEDKNNPAMRKIIIKEGIIGPIDFR